MVNENKNYHYNIFLKKVHVKINPIHNIFKWMFLYYKCFFVFGRIYDSERIDDNKTSEWKECDSCNYWYFFNNDFRFEPNVCNRCHDLLMMSMNLCDTAILNIKGSDYRCIVSRITGNDAINVMQNADLTEKVEHKT